MGRAVRNTEHGIRVVASTIEPPDAAVRVTVAASGICGSDLHLAALGPSPVTLGHEFCGRLDDGTAVAVLPTVSCGSCPACTAGQDQQCATMLGRMYGITQDGGMADEAWVDPRCAIPLPAAVPLADASLVEPLAVALHGLHRVSVGPESRVLVIGAGPIGLCTIAAAGHLGVHVDVEGHRTRRMKAAERLGASTAVGSEYDVVVDAAGGQGSMDRAVDLVRPGGAVASLGTFWHPVTLGLAFQMKEVQLISAFTYGHHHGTSEFEEAVGALATIPELAPTLITHRFALDDAAEAFRVAGDRHDDAVKVVLHP